MLDVSAAVVNIRRRWNLLQTFRRRRKFIVGYLGGTAGALLAGAVLAGAVAGVTLVVMLKGIAGALPAAGAVF